MAANEARSKIMMVGFLVLVMAVFAIGHVLKGASKANDPGFANYAVNSSGVSGEGLDGDTPDFEVQAAAEAEAINAGSFKPYVAGDLSPTMDTAPSVIR